jgi:hypothetical protein
LDESDGEGAGTGVRVNAPERLLAKVDHHPPELVLVRLALVGVELKGVRSGVERRQRVGD